MQPPLAVVLKAKLPVRMLKDLTPSACVFLEAIYIRKYKEVHSNFSSKASMRIISYVVVLEK